MDHTEELRGAVADFIEGVENDLDLIGKPLGEAEILFVESINIRELGTPELAAKFVAMVTTREPRQVWRMNDAVSPEVWRLQLVR